MKKKFIFISVILAALFLTFVSCGKKADKSDQAKSSYPSEMKDSVIIVTVGVDSLNVLEVLKADHDVNEVSSAMGTFVKGIDGVENDMHTFWFFEVNGEMATKAADKILTTASDTIKWYFRQPGSEKPTGESKPAADNDTP